MALGHWDPLTLWSLGPFCPRRLQNLRIQQAFSFTQNSHRIKVDSKRNSLRLRPPIRRGKLRAVELQGTPWQPESRKVTAFPSVRWMHLTQKKLGAAY